MTFAFRQKQLAPALAADLVAQPLPGDLQTDATPPAAAPAAPWPAHAWLRQSVRLASPGLLWRLARPLALRARGFLQREIDPKLDALRLQQEQAGETLRRMERLLASGAQAPRGEPAQAPRLRRKVHQFHAGSATGDAITNAMLMIQQQLRAMGFASEIFVEHVGPGLEHRVQPLDALPRHDDHVLLQHHSIGHDGFDRVIASPAPKVLIYHNITPPELLSHSPGLQRAVELGRRQLLQLRHQVVAALADSVFNGIELRGLGFPCVLEATLLFDIDALLRTAQSHAPRRVAAPFTVLFVGRMVPSKGQADLVDAFAVFARRWFALSGRRARLVLAGVLSPGSDPYQTEIETRIEAQGLAGHVLMTGKLSDADLHGWFGAADLYVSLSRHEGFGVPLVEAMAHGVPVIALRAGAVAHTLGDGGMLLHSADPETVATAMLTIARDPRHAGEIAGRQLRTLQSWALPHHLPALRHALAMAGAPPPDVAGTPAAVAAGMQIDILADVAIPATRLLQKGLAEAGLGRAGGGGPHVAITMDGSEAPSPATADVRLAMIGCTASPLSLSHVRRLNQRFHGVLVPSERVARALVESGVAVPIRMVGGHQGAAFQRLPADPGLAMPAPDALTPRRWAERIAAAAADIVMTPPAQPLRIGWVTSWGVRCGIAEYSRQLLSSFSRDHAETTVVLSDSRPSMPDLPPGPRALPCFAIGDTAAADNLALAIGAEDPDVLVIQHHPAILSWPVLANLLERPAVSQRCAVVVLHNTRDLRKLDPVVRERLAAGLAGISRVLVHTTADLTELSAFGVGNAAWMPQGCAAASQGGSVTRSFGAAPRIGATGFLLPPKGFQRLLRAAALLLQEWPDLRVRLVTAIYPAPHSTTEHAECQALAAELGLQRHVEWHTGFEPAARVMELLAPCDVLVLPYAPTDESSSAAARQAISSSVPTLVSDQTVFDDLGDAVARLKSTEPEAIAAAIAALLRNADQRAHLQQAAQRWITAHDWTIIAERMQGMLAGLHREHRTLQQANAQG